MDNPGLSGGILGIIQMISFRKGVQGVNRSYVEMMRGFVKNI